MAMDRLFARVAFGMLEHARAYLFPLSSIRTTESAGFLKSQTHAT